MKKITLIIVLAILVAGGVFVWNKYYRQIGPLPEDGRAQTAVLGEKFINEKGEVWGPLPEGKQTFKVASSEEVRPKFVEADINPLKVAVGDTQKMRVVVHDEVEIISVIAEVETDNGTVEVPLGLVDRSAVAKAELMNQEYFVQEGKLVVQDGDKEKANVLETLASSVQAAGLQRFVYEGEWVVRDTHVRTYRTTFRAKDEKGQENSMTMAWSDPCTGIVDSSATSTLSGDCTLGTGIVDGIDDADLNLGSQTLTLSASSTFAWSPGKTITIASGTILIGEGAQLTQAYICVKDSDGDGWAEQAFGQNTDQSSTCATYGAGHFRRSAGGGTSSSQTLSPRTVGVSTATGTISWTNTINATSSDNLYSSVSLSAGQASRYLLGYNFGFTIPDTARIDGIKIEMERSVTGDGTISDNPGARAVKNFAIVSIKGPQFAQSKDSERGLFSSIGSFIRDVVVNVAHALPIDYLDGDEGCCPEPELPPPPGPTWTSDTTFAWGGPTSIWGGSWAPAEINATGFGAALGVKATGASASMRVDQIQVTVYYTTGGVLGITDCYDSASSTRPNVSPYTSYTVDRGDGSYDYDCDTLETKSVSQYYSGSVISNFSVCKTGICTEATCSTINQTSTPACGVGYISKSCTVPAVCVSPAECVDTIKPYASPGNTNATTSCR